MGRKGRGSGRRGLGIGTGLLFGLMMAPGAVRADATLPGGATGALHVGKKALDLVGQMALEKVPAHIDLPTVQKDLLSCSTGLGVTGAYVDLQPKSLTFTPAEGSLTLSTVLDLSGYAHVNLKFGSGCLSALSCDVGFAATGLAPSAAIQLSITEGKPTVGLGALSAMVAPGGLHLDFQNCALDLIPSSVIDDVAVKLLDLVQGPLGDQLRQQVPPLVQSQLATMLTKSGSVAGYGFAAQVTDLKMTAQGIDAYAAIGVDYEGAAAACLPPDAVTATPRNPTPAGSTLALPTGPTSSIVVGVSTDLLSSALKAAWQAGMMCIDDSAIAGLGFDPGKLSSLVPGLPKDLSMHFTMGLDQAPTIDDDGKGSIRMHVKGAELLVSMSSPGQPTAGVAMATDFTVAVAPSVDPLSGAVYAELTDLSMERMELHAGASASSYSLDPERLSVLMRDVVLPMASQRLKGMPLSPDAFGMAGVYGWLADLSVKDAAIYVGAEAFRPGPASDDVAAPTTLLTKTPGKLVRAGLARFGVSGTDDTTPPQLLRYEWQVDDQPLQPPSFQRVISAPVTTAGTHTFRVRAVDLFDKAGSDFQTYTFELDPVPPTLEIVEQPDVALRATEATIRLTGTDDRSAPNLLSFAYRVAARPAGGDAKLIAAAEPTGLEGGMGEIHLDHLDESTTYEVTVLLYDEAGNVTSQKVGFGVASASGCSVSAGPTPTSKDAPAALLLALGLLVLVRRRASVLR